MTQTAPKRAYHSPLREQRAQETRDRVIAAAAELFNLHGFAGTTMSAIAREAGVSVESVHAVGTKGSLLVEAYTPTSLTLAVNRADAIPNISSCLFTSPSRTLAASIRCLLSSRALLISAL